MGSLSAAEQRKLAYFHALGKVMTENTQAVYESQYKSSHNVRLNEVWSDDIDYAVDYTAAVSESTTNSAVTLIYQGDLTQIFGSNGQSYNFFSGATFIRPWISPVDIPHSVTNLPSFGYEVRLFDGTNSEIYLTEGAWSVDYYAGIIHFAEDYTPTDMGWGAIKASFFQYTGNFGTSGGTSDPSVFKTATFDSGTTEMIFNQGTSYEQSIDLSFLDNNDAFIDATFDSGTSTITLTDNLSNTTLVDLSSLKTVSGSTSAMSPNNTNMLALSTNSGSTLACSTSIISGNVLNSKVAVFVNGIQYNVGNLVFDDCYFSSDSGITPKASGNENAGDLLYWNYSGTNAIAGFDLNTSVPDRITFIHLTV